MLWTSAGAFTPAGNGDHATTRSSSRPHRGMKRWEGPGWAPSLVWHPQCGSSAGLGSSALAASSPGAAGAAALPGPARGLVHSPGEPAPDPTELTGLHSALFNIARQKSGTGTNFPRQLVWERAWGGDQTVILASAPVCSGNPRGRKKKKRDVIPADIILFLLMTFQTSQVSWEKSILFLFQNNLQTACLQKEQ